MKNLKRYSSLIVIILIHELWVIFIQNALFPIHFTPNNLFTFELIGKQVNIPSAILFFLGTGNIILLWLISKRIFAGFYLIPPIIYAISPWGSYLVVAGSFYIYLSFLLLLACYSILLIRSGRRFVGSILLVGAMLAAMYSSLLLFLVLPVVFILLVVFKITPFINSKLLISLIILLSPLLFLIYGNKLGFKNIINNEIKIFEDPGLLNMVNSYQGNANQQGFGQLARLSENRYIFFSEYILLKFTKQFVPSTIFTPQEKLLNFSFSPPIYLGFLIPFAFGLYQILKFSNFKKLLFLSTLLVIPSILAKPMVDLNRLFILMPVLILITAYGLILFLKQRQNKILFIFLAISIFLVAFQLLVTLSDIRVREKDRFIKYYGQNYELGKQ